MQSTMEPPTAVMYPSTVIMLPKPLRQIVRFYSIVRVAEDAELLACTMAVHNWHAGAPSLGTAYQMAGDC